MAALDDNDDVQAIRTLIEAHFPHMQWIPSTRADWPAFEAFDDIGPKNIRIREILRLLQHFVFETRENY